MSLNKFKAENNTIQNKQANKPISWKVLIMFKIHDAMSFGH